MAESVLESLHPDARALWVLYHEFLWYVLPEHPDRWPELAGMLDSAIAAGGPAAELAEQLKNPPNPPRHAFGQNLAEPARDFGYSPQVSDRPPLITVTNLEKT